MRRWILRSLASGLAASLALVGLLIAPAPAPAWPRAHRDAAGRRHVQVVAAVGTHAGVRVPRSFLGLATEYYSMPLYETHLRLFERLLHLLRPADGSPLQLRVGGLSGDNALWLPSLKGPLPEHAIGLTPADIAGIATVVRDEHLHVILDLNLAADVPAMEAAMVSDAVHTLPHGSITAVEIGNEPDFYRFALRGNPSYYPSSYTPDLYATRFEQYAAALHAVAPSLKIAGPALANPVADFGYMSDLVAHDRRSLGMLTVHRYALSACAPVNTTLHPTITRLLRSRASLGLAATLDRSVALARAAHLPLRWDEMNSVTCGGTLGVSDAFASALWGTDTLFSALQVGVDGVNVQMRATALNAPFYLTGAGVLARPLLYGMLLFNRALGPGARLVHVSLHEPGMANVSAWATRLRRGRTNVVLLNKGASAENVLVHVRGARSADVQRLLASSVLTQSQVTLAGQRIDRAGEWAGHRRVARVRCGGGACVVSMPAFSGALVSVSGRR